MPSFRYRAVHAEGQLIKGVAAAVNEADLIRYLQQNRMELIEAREKKEIQPFIKFIQASSPRDLTVFCAQMHDVVQAGVPFVEALHEIAHSLPVNTLREALVEIERSLQHGATITAAFARHRRIFPPVFIAILSAGEASGDLAETFGRLATYTEGRAKMNERLKRALRYPLFLLAVSVGVFVFMMMFVVPQIVQFLSSIDNELPVMTRILVSMSNAVATGWWMAALAIIVLTAGVMVMRRLSNDAAQTIDRMILRLPILGRVMAKIMLARFAHSFALLFQSGIDIPESLTGARATLENRELIYRLDGVMEQVKSGKALSVAMTGLFPPFACRMMKIGEQSGRLGKSLADIAATYDREAADAADRMLGALEPLLTFMVGGLLAWIVLAVIGPIYGSLAKLNMMGG